MGGLWEGEGGRKGRRQRDEERKRRSIVSSCIDLAGEENTVVGGGRRPTLPESDRIRKINRQSAIRY